jgi:DNA-binding GntR family transcriptional regulator
MGADTITALRANAASSRDSSLDTFVERATALIHHDILTGALAPDAKLGIHELAKRYGMGPTPIREALSRLCPRGFVQATANRGFRVRPVSREDLEDIVGTRLVIEIEALRRCIERGDDEWEASILAALHRFQKFVGRDPQAFWQGNFEYDRLHKQFHTALISACGLPRLLEMHEILYDQTYRYRCVALDTATRKRPLRLNEAHTRLAKFVVNRDVDAACEELARQIQSTLLNCYPEGQSNSKSIRTPKLKK